jgi:hypothetical protein
MLQRFVCELLVQDVLSLEDVLLCFVGTGLVDALLATIKMVEARLGPERCEAPFLLVAAALPVPRPLCLLRAGLLRRRLAARVQSARLDLTRVLDKSQRGVRHMLLPVEALGLEYLFPLLQLRAQARRVAQRCMQDEQIATAELAQGLQALKCHGDGQDEVAMISFALFERLAACAPAAWAAHAAAVSGLLAPLATTYDRQVALVEGLVQANRAASHPEGFVLRCCVALYDADVVEEEAWLGWQRQASTAGEAEVWPSHCLGVFSCGGRHVCVFAWCVFA